MRRKELFSLLCDYQSTITWCRAHELLIASVVCSVCRSEMVEVSTNKRDHNIWQCRKMVSGVRHQQYASIRKSSFFEDSKLELRDILFILYEWTRLTTVEDVSYEYDISEHTVGMWYKKIGVIVSSYMNVQSRGQIGGEGEIVEIDECQIGRRKHHRGRAPTQVWIIGGVVRNSNQQSLFFERVRNRKAETLTQVIQRRVHQGSRIVTDGWKGYNNLSSLGFHHSVVNHSVNFVDPIDSEVHTQNVENLWRCLRRFLHGRSNYSRHQLLRYIDEYAFRKTTIDHFETLISLISSVHFN
jgi:transposase-like protein